jgi:glutamyl-tRNA synthetase
MEDLDRATSSQLHEQRQLADLASIGIDWDGEVVRQSDRFDLYHSAIDRLRAADLIYPCYCTRREIRAEIESAASAPHVNTADGAYPGTCRELTSAQLSERESSGRPPAWRLRTDRDQVRVVDEVAGSYSGVVDDFVVARADGVPAYNLAVVVDDELQGVTQVVRGDDLLSSTPRHVHLQRLLGYSTPLYLHVPLVYGPDGQRLAKRDGAVTLADLAGCGIGVAAVQSALVRSIGLAVPEAGVDVNQLIDKFEWSDLRAESGLTLASMTELMT